ncbi:hypothetical protein Slin15195_G042210 [Septoria linicola]|uniref:Uncharacterized protein n=1 Tax=Septoria linicola TaxID=215465 RepID=A0A9Q9AK68_9PEZI|nr:hypothetical protein Slin14017_G045720 [Septoria linicola]USW50902.1 hypothetical protein Slin15195_G042210 [Septoria linicola]
MQSSPPVRAWTQPRRDSQPESEYSLDLAALDLDGPDDTDTRIPEPKVDRIFSEDIDGPSDFTQNMDAWMRGGTMGRGTSKKKKSAGTPAQTILERNEELKEQEVQTHDFLKVPQNGDDDAEGDITESHHTPDNSPPKISVLANSQFEEGFSSEWHTDGEGSPPVPPNHKQFLQPTVEDYYSELSPARQALQQSTRGRSLHNSVYSTQKHSPAKDGSRSPGRASSPTLSPVRSPMLQRTSTQGTYTRQTDHESRLEMEEQFKQLDAKCAQLEHLNEALGQALDEERRARKHEKSNHESHAAESARREQDLIEMKELAHRHNAEFRREFSQLKEQLLNQQKLTDLARSGEDGKQQSHDAEIEQLRKQLEIQQIEHDKQCKAFEQDLAAVRRGRDQAEKAASDLREELEAERDHYEAKRQRFQTELQQAHDDEAAISELERELLQSKSEIENHKSAKIEADDQIKTVREQLAAAKRAHEDDVSRTSNERTRAVELAAGLQRQLQELKQELLDEQTAHEAELERVRSQQNSSSSTSTQELEIIRTELESKQSELNMAVIERDEAQDTITSLTVERNSLQSKVKHMESVNAALDAKVSETIQKRERHWKAKLVESNREREIMARTLMHQWGRQEAGVESPQMYAYKYAGKPAEEEKENSKPRAAP